ncbi:MAG: translation initiation factor [Saprospiraceae bacterium]|nr:translation initiation factor [Saprospiraceae bacterium]
MDKNKNTSLNWDEFRKLGNPENAPDTPSDNEETGDASSNHSNDKIRIYLDRKSRKGKEVTIIAGHEGEVNELKDLGKELKSACGVGGTVKNGEIILQGNHRKKVMKILEDKGFKNVKLAGG